MCLTIARRRAPARGRGSAFRPVAKRAQSPRQRRVRRRCDIEAPVTDWLKLWRGGQGEAFAAVLPAVYQELRQVAARALRRESGASTLQPTALVHEAWLRLAQVRPADWQDRRHFVAGAARLMRQILIDHARAAATDKRAGGERVDLSRLDLAASPEPVDLLALEQALERLEQVDPRKAQLVELRVFAGLDFEEIGDALGVSRATLHRDWRGARAFLYRCLSDSAA